VKIKFIDPVTGEDRVLDADITPIMVVFSDTDIDNVSRMQPDDHKYLAYPENSFTEDEASAWMSLG
jgi:hypothetical protein